MARTDPISETVWPEIAFFADRVRKAREEKSLSQKELAIALDTAQSYIASIENRKVNPKLQSMVVLARVLDKPLSFFILDRD